MVTKRESIYDLGYVAIAMFHHQPERFLGNLLNDSYLIYIMYGIYTPCFFVKMTGHGFDNKPKLYLDRIFIQWAIES